MLDAQLIAVVDDDRSVRRALGRLLSSAGYDVRLFASGLELLASPAIGDANCLLLDVHLGDISGFEVCTRARQAGALAAVVFMTAHDSDETRARAACHQSTAYLRKPFTAADLLGALRAAMGENPAVQPAPLAPSKEA